MLTRLRSISASEGAVCGDEALDKILTVSGGDMRKAVTTLQSVHNFYGDKADAEAVVEVSGTLPDDCIEALSDKPGGFVERPREASAHREAHARAN